ncbi:MAG: hypothetical protein ACKVW3_06000 [Phycisphaerales bacterium]
MHESDDTIAEYLLGEVDSAVRDEFESRIRAYDELRLRVEQMRRVLDGLRTAPASADSFAVSARSRAMLLKIATTPAGGLGATTRELIARVRAVLQADTADVAAIAGFRGTGNERHLRFESAAGQIAIRLETTGPARVALVGHFEGPDVPAEATAQRGDERVSGPLDDLGFFELEVPPGEWTVRLASAETEIELPPIQVGE